MKIIKRILSKYKLLIIIPFNLVLKSIIYAYEMLIFIFDKSTRVCFTNIWKGFKWQYFFLSPLEQLFESFDHSYKIVQYYKPHIEYFSVFGKKNKIVRSKAQCKVFFSGENVNDKRICNGDYKGYCIDNVSLSLGFDYIESKNYLRFPLWLLYYFLPDNSKDDIRNILNNFKKNYNKVKFCSLVASHDRSGIRAKIYNTISNISNVDCPGKLLHNDDTLHKQYADNKAVYLQQYKFNICPENSISKGYVTEKLFDSLYSGCIPIYNGWSKDPEPDIINPNIILWYDESDENNNKSLIDEIKKLYLNDNLYNSFINQPFFCDTAVDKIYEMLQQFTKMTQEAVYKSLNNLSTNIIGLGKTK